MAECLIVGRRSRAKSERAIFVMLAAAAGSAAGGGRDSPYRPGAPHLPRVVWRMVPSAARRFELAMMWSVRCLDAPLPPEGPWPLSRVSDVEIAQTAYQLAELGHLWLSSELVPTQVPICRLGDLADFGPVDRDIDGVENRGTVLRGPFDIVAVEPGSEPTYPVLWSDRADAERTLVIAA